MLWYKNEGKDSDVVVSSRVRIARNISDYPFSPKLSEDCAKEIVDRVREAVGDGYEFIDFAAISPVEAQSYVEKNEVTEEFAAMKSPRALLRREDDGVDISVGGEDHVRVQCIKSGMALDEALAAIIALDDALDSRLNIAYDEKLGYLTKSPTDLGTAMRASVMMFLPGLTGSREMLMLQAQLGKIGLTVRGMNGEGSSADGCLYQISNRITLGITEQETIDKLKDIAAKITERERKARESITGAAAVRFNDTVQRSLGTLAYAGLMDYGELMGLYGNIRLGVALGMCKPLSYGEVDSLIYDTRPSTLALAVNNGEVPSDRAERDAKRAEYIRGVINKKA